MRVVAIEELKTGDRLGKDVYANPADGLPLLRAGVRVSDSYRSSMQRAGILSVWIDDVISDGIEPLEVLEDETKRRATAAIHDAFKDITGSMKSGGKVVMDQSRLKSAPKVKDGEWRKESGSHWQQESAKYWQQSGG